MLVVAVDQGKLVRLAELVVAGLAVLKQSE
jgi:hypothetical protein